MTAQRSRDEVDALFRRACETRKDLYGTMNCYGCSYRWPEGPELNAMRALDAAISEYYRTITLEKTYNALRDAITLAEAEIDKYHKLMVGCPSASAQCAGGETVPRP